MRSGPLRERCKFFRRTVIEGGDGFGNTRGPWEAKPFLERSGQFVPTAGLERLEAGGLESQVSGILKIRYSAAAAAITAERDKVQIDGEDYQIQAVFDRTRRRRALELTVTRGVAV